MQGAALCRAALAGSRALRSLAVAAQHVVCPAGTLVLSGCLFY